MKGDMVYYARQIIEANSNSTEAFGPDDDWTAALMNTAVTGIKAMAESSGIDFDRTEPKLLFCKPQSHGYTNFSARTKSFNPDVAFIRD